MPIIESTYKPSYIFKNNHINTVYKTVFYNNSVNYSRKRISTPDNDFLDLDFSTVGSNTIVIALHGLEGSSNSKYILSTIKYLNSQNKDCVAVNFRGCSGSDNSKIYSYNSGKTDDLEMVINYISENYHYKNIILLGYSMGGNIALKFLGENSKLASEIKCAIAISVPCDLEGSSFALAKWNNAIYLKRFMSTLRKKTLLKLEKFPESNLNKDAIISSKTFEDFDNAVTAPLFGYTSAEDYWRKCSSKQFIEGILMPTLIINAQDDSFLSETCYPVKEANHNHYIYLETPKYGGHVGFNNFYFGKETQWSEKRILNFMQQYIS